MAAHRETASRAPLRFGTNGWRGVLGAEVTTPRLRDAVRGIAEWVRQSGGGRPLLVARDRRPFGEHLLDVAVEELESLRIPVEVASGPIPTPVLSRSVREGDFAGGLLITASHNPMAYQGLKVIESNGSAASRDTVKMIEAKAAKRSARVAARSRGAPAGSPRTRDLTSPYIRDLVKVLDVDALRSSGLTLHHDAMHGAGAQILSRVLERCGVTVRLHRSEAPRPCGEAPDPNPGRLVGIARAVRAQGGLCLGVATDGDADRYAALDSDGRVLTETQTVALLVDHLARSGRIRTGVAISVATGSLVERVAKSHGLRVTRHAMGFRALAQQLIEGRADVAGEESGGFALGSFTFDKDGMLAACLLAELVAASAQPLRAHLRKLERDFGASHCSRAAIPATRQAREALGRIRRAPPERLCREAVQAAEVRGGLRLELADGFLMLRCSGTEPAIRLYAEAPDRDRLAARLQAGIALLASD